MAVRPSALTNVGDERDSLLVNQDQSHHPGVCHPVAGLDRATPR